MPRVWQGNAALPRSLMPSSPLPAVTSRSSAHCRSGEGPGDMDTRGVLSCSVHSLVALSL